MARKTKTQPEETVSNDEITSIEKEETTNPAESGSDNESNCIEKTDEAAEVTNDFSILFEAKANKLSPKSEGHITFQLIKDNDDVISLQLLANTSGGNFSKNPVPLKLIIDVLAKQSADRGFKSSIIKDVFIGKGAKSSNNPAFLICALRTPEVGLITASVTNKFLSYLSKDFEAQSKKLLNL